MKIIHDDVHLDWIRRKMESLGVYDYRFCKESNCYVCDKNGDFYSVCKVIKRKDDKPFISYRFLPITGTIEGGYVKIRVNVDGKRKHINAHRMMLNAWLGYRDDLVINHIDGNKTNNKLLNLEYCTVAENNSHALLNKLYNPTSFKKRRFVIPSYDWLTIFVLHKHLEFSFRELSKMNDCSRGAIKKIYTIVDNLMKEAKVNEKRFAAI